jgi:hypothetical protein
MMLSLESAGRRVRPFRTRGEELVAFLARVEIQAVLGSLAPQFWTSEWTAKSLDTQAGRQMGSSYLRWV